MPRYWTAARAETIKSGLSVGLSLAEVAAEHRATVAAIKHVCREYEIPYPNHRGGAREQRGVAFDKPKLSGLAVSWLRSPTLAIADVRNFEAQATPAPVRMRGADPDDADEPEDVPEDEPEDTPAHRKMVEWQASGMTPQQACRRLGECENRSWLVVLAHLKRQMADRCEW